MEAPGGAVGVSSAPFLKWAGGKRRLLPALLEHVPERFGTYYEPFVGAGALFFELRPKSAVLADLNQELIHTFRMVRDDVDSVIEQLKQMPITRSFFYHLRSARVCQGSAAWQAARFIYLNKTCFNGLYRVNRKGQCNSPYGDYASPVVCDEQRLLDCAKVLEGVWLNAIDFESIVFGSDDFVYFDPPYVAISQTANFCAYTPDGFGWQDHKRLAAFASRLKKRGTKVLLTNADHPDVRELYRDGFEMRSVEVSRPISSNASTRGPVSELIIW
jgi:DNA adenine methylase